MVGKRQLWAMLWTGLTLVTFGSAQFTPVNPQAGPPYTAPPSSSTPYEGAQQTPGYDSPADDMADRQHGAARLSVIEGGVGIRRGDTSEVVSAVINSALLGRDRIETAPDGRAEVELDSANIVRAAGNTDLGFADLSYRRFQVQVGGGTIIYRVLRPSPSQAEIDTPSIALRPQGPCEIRVEIQGDGTTRISIRSGSAEIFGPRGSVQIAAGHDVLVRGNPSDPEYQDTYPVALDRFDDWSRGRDHILLSSLSAQYVSPDMSGAEDLDNYGSWVPSDYGQVWEPQPPYPDWSPYSYGQWNWAPYYGWVWIDSAPWGWAPYHYGRWFMNGNRGWCWWPGPRVTTQLWSPALVGFFRYGGGGGLGWVPLAPSEGLRAWWGRGIWRSDFRGQGWPSFARRGPVYTSTPGIMGAYRNASYRGGALLAGTSSFSGPQRRFPVATPQQLGASQLFAGRLPIAPNRSSYQVSPSRQLRVSPSVSSGANRRFFTIQSPRLQPRADLRSRQNGFNIPVYRGSDTRSSAPGWQRFGDPGSASNAYRPAPLRDPGESAWHQFGRPSAPATPGRSWQSPRSGPYQGGAGGFGFRAPAPPVRSAPSYPGRFNPALSAPSARGSMPGSRPMPARPQSYGAGGGSHGGAPGRHR